MTDLLTTAEAARELRLGEQTIRRLCVTGILAHRRVGTRGRSRNGTILIERAELSRYLDARLSPAC